MALAGLLVGRILRSGSSRSRSIVNGLHQQSKGDKTIHLWTERKPRTPEFNHKMTRKALWVDGRSTPAWVKARLKLLTQGRLQSRADGIVGSVIRQMSGVARFYNPSLPRAQHELDAFRDQWRLQKAAAELCGREAQLAQPERRAEAEALAGFQGVKGHDNNVAELEASSPQTLPGAAKWSEAAKMLQQNRIELFQQNTNSLKVELERVGHIEAQLTGRIAANGVQEIRKLVPLKYLSRYMMPAYITAENAGVEGGVTVGKLLQQESLEIGCDEARGDYVDIVKAGIIDPVKFITTARTGAASVSSLTTTEAVMNELPKDDFPAFPPGGMGDQGGMCDSSYTQLERSFITFSSYLDQRSQQSKGDKKIHLWRERKRGPEFNHRMTRKALSVDGSSTPAWTKARLTLIAQGRLQSRASYVTGDRSQDTAQGNSSLNMHSAGTTIEAIAVLKNRLDRGITTDSYTYVRVLQMCLKQKDLLAAKQVHDCIIESGLDKNTYLANTLLNVYIRCGGILDARRVFDEFEKKSVITWNTMIAGYAKSDHAESALELFKSMRQEGAQPNEVTYLCILKACASPLALKWGEQVHECIRQAGFESDVRVGTALLQMYAKCGCITEARRVFEKLTNRNLITWNIMIGAYAESGRGVEAYRLFLEMRREGFEPDAITYLSILNASASAGALEWVKEVHGHASEAGLESDLRVGNALVHMYAKSGSLDDARTIFDRLKTLDVITWSIMIGAYAERGRGVEAYGLFLQMRREGLEPDAITYMSILNASASVGSLEWVKEVHGHARKAGLECDLRVGNALVHMYARAGSIDDARLVFDRMEKRDVITWTGMMGGLAQHGCAHEALELFRKMTVDRVKPDGAAFVAVLSACCHAGLLDDGRRLFLAMTQVYGIEPDIVHCTCMVDLLGRAGHLEEAKLFISDMPVEPNAVTWGAFLGACRTYGNVELGELATQELLKLEPNNAAAYVLLSNIYAAAGKWDKVSWVRTMMQKRGVRKEPGCTWIEVDNKIHEFVVGDISHPEAKAIYTYINKLTEKLKAEGYIPETQTVLQNIDHEDKELALCCHSEKLAIAYGLMRTARKPIRVYKNLRVCSDCHTATKFMSKVTGRDIIARDATRFHHFKDGVCSCGDYW